MDARTERAPPVRAQRGSEFGLKVEAPVPPEAPAVEQPATPEETPRVRRPFGTQEQKLAYAQREGFHRHWFNDTPGRVDDAVAAGYTHVKDARGQNVSRLVGRTEGGDGLNAFLMEIPDEWFQQDKAAKQARVDEVDQAIRKGEINGKVGEEGRYVPRDGIKIT